MMLRKGFDINIEYEGRLNSVTQEAEIVVSNAMFNEHRYEQDITIGLFCNFNNKLNIKLTNIL